jgi:hypothetical protein
MGLQFLRFGSERLVDSKWDVNSGSETKLWMGGSNKRKRLTALQDTKEPAMYVLRNGWTVV